MGEKTFRATRNNNSIPESSCKNPGVNFKFLYAVLLVDMDGIGIVKKTVVIRLPKFPGAEVRITVFEEIYKTIKIFILSYRIFQSSSPKHISCQAQHGSKTGNDQAFLESFREIIEFQRVLARTQLHGPVKTIGL